jgi:hypothetical protein
MPRRSAASLSVVPAASIPPAPPPAGLTAEEAQLWRQIVAGLPPRWLPAGSLPMLEVYCRSVCGMRTTAAVMNAEVEGSPAHSAASRLYRQEAAMVVKTGKLLRLGPRFDRTKQRLVPAGPRPWEIGGGSRPASNGLTFDQEEEARRTAATEDETPKPPAA